MYSNIFFKAIEVPNINSNFIKEDDGDIKLYKIELIRYYELVPDLTIFLSPSERDRANRYHFVKDKKRFTICRALLKILLAEHIGITTDEIILDINSNKKPYLSSHPSVFFNVSHAGDYALIGLATSPIGVDIEYINKSFDYHEVLPHIFHKIEIDEVNNNLDKHRTFYKFWTRKEAIVKAIGKGIDDNLVKLPVTDGLHSVPSALVRDYKKMTVFSFNVTDDYLGAIAFTEYPVNLEKLAYHPVPTTETLNFLIQNKK